MAGKFAFMEKKKPEKKAIAGILIVIVAVLAVFFFVFNLNSFKKTSIESDNNNLLPGFSSSIIPESSQNSEGLMEERKAYGIPLAVFEELPVPPPDFNRIVSLMHKNLYTNYDFFSKDYYLQPEFYPSFKQNGLEYWLKPSTTHWAAYGYGYFPIKETVFVQQEGKKKTVFFLHSGYGVRSFQGMMLKPEFLDENAKQFLEVNISEPVFLLGPSFPKFDKAWARAVFVEVFAKKNAPKKNFSVKIIIVDPPIEYAEKWKQELGSQYVDVGFASKSAQSFELEIIVE
ncbi:MAG: hypothetical protein QXK06_05345 [Candidatus Diapherotrites archaeon]